MDPYLVEKYNVAGPRYTSYPTVPFWKIDLMKENDWLESITRNIQYFGSTDISLYIHLPFCESLCTFCGCHKRITKNHSVEEPYIDTLIKEWNIYLKRLQFNPSIKELHFGGGTPTFFKADELIRLLREIFQSDKVDPEKVHLSFEAHPMNTTKEHLQKLFDFGFRRLSLGIQDYNPEIQKSIHRIQSFDSVKKAHETARTLGYTSISHDLVFGLPKQTLKDIEFSIDKTLELKPDRISLYSYAHVPWIKGNGQRGFSESDLPSADYKRQLYECAKVRLLSAGYIEIGMDHFALETDEMAHAFLSRSLHRNFMGYTINKTNLLIGLGMSAISDSWFGFAQNEKNLETYSNSINEKHLALSRGHLLTELELEIRKYILDLMCHFETSFKENSKHKNVQNEIEDRLKDLIDDGLVELKEGKVIVTGKGIPFVRNCCMQFDLDLIQSKNRERMFSKTI